MKVLVVKLTSLGDVIHTLPAISDAAKQVADIDVHWLVEENFQIIPGWHRSVSKIFTSATRRWRRQPSKFVAESAELKKQLNTEQYDLIIDVQGLLKSAVLARYAKGTRIGYDKNSVKEPLASRFYDRGIAVDKHNHAVTRTRQLFAKVFDYDIPDRLDYGISIDQFQRNDKSNYLVFLHGTTWSSKQWPVQSWQQLVSIAATKGYQVKLLWGNDSEYNRATKIAQVNDAVSVCAKMDLNEIATLLTNAAGVVAVDTGIGHLAAALSVPCLSLYGATDSARTGTIGNLQKHLQAKFECSPCLRKTCTVNGGGESDPACFEQFSPEMVWQELKRLIKVNQ